MEDEGIKRELCGRGTEWTPSDLELLQKLIDDGLNLEEIVSPRTIFIVVTRSPSCFNSVRASLGVIYSCKSFQRIARSCGFIPAKSSSSVSSRALITLCMRSFVSAVTLFGVPFGLPELPF